MASNNKSHIDHIGTLFLSIYNNFPKNIPISNLFCPNIHDITVNMLPFFNIQPTKFVLQNCPIYLFPVCNIIQYTLSLYYWPYIVFIQYMFLLNLFAYWHLQYVTFLKYYNIWAQCNQYTTDNKESYIVDSNTRHIQCVYVLACPIYGFTQYLTFLNTVAYGLNLTNIQHMSTPNIFRLNNWSHIIVSKNNVL